MRRRIVVLAVLAAILATSLFGVPLAIGAASYYVSDEKNELEVLADTVAITLSADLVQGQRPDTLPETESETTLGLYDATGTRTLGRGPDTADDLVTAALAGTTTRGTTGGDLVVAVPVSEDRAVIAVVRAATPRSQVYGRTLTTWLIMAGLAMAAVAFTWVVARRQAARLAAPLEALAGAADALGVGDFGARTEPSGIAEIDTAGRSLNRTAHRLDALLTRERAFSADASHQLRTPLTGLRLHLETAQDPSGSAEQTAQAIQAALTGVDRLERTIDDLLSLTRRPQEGQPLEVPGLLDQIRAGWHAPLAAQGRPLRLRPEPDLPATVAAPAAVRQILAVLLDNALRHGRGAVTVTVRDAGEILAIDIDDEGAGLNDPIAPERVPPAGPHGRGLDLARSLAEGEGGRLICQPGSALFTLLLPAHPGQGETVEDENGPHDIVDIGHPIPRDRRLR
ncbi:MAG: histidine kinase dimerization/phospho-acceptor domain-containing protein [Nocardioides sp.]